MVTPDGKQFGFYLLGMSCQRENVDKTFSLMHMLKKKSNDAVHEVCVNLQ